MNFNENLNFYIEKIGCSSKELAIASNISAPVICRFRNDKKKPNIKNGQLDKLVDGLFMLAKKNKISLSRGSIYTVLSNTYDAIVEPEILRENLNIIISILKINTPKLAKYMNFSVSYISKIRSGVRTPFNTYEFTNLIVKYVMKNHTSNEDKIKISILLDCDINKLDNNNLYYQKFMNWFSTKNYNTK